MNKSKDCIMCFSPIDERAKKCPHCRSLQAKYSNLENNPLLIGLLGLFIIAIFSFILYDNIFVKGKKEIALSELKTSVSDVSSKLENDVLYVACLGEIDNPSPFKFNDIKFKVDLLSAQDELVDTFSVEDEDLQLAANGSTNFRVRGVAQKEASVYQHCQVTIADAWAYK